MKELGIGRTPLREAVKRLALENLVEVQPRRGTFVTAIEAADIQNITEVRAELEGYAAELAALRLDPEMRARPRTPRARDRDRSTARASRSRSCDSTSASTASSGTPPATRI